MTEFQIKTAIDNFEECLLHVYKTEELRCVSSSHYQYKDITFANYPVSNYEKEWWHPYKNHLDIKNCNADLMYHTGLLYMYRPFINNPSREIDFTFEEPNGTYFQTREDRRYLMNVTACFEKSYNFWGRLALMMYSFFPEITDNEKEISFPFVIDKLVKMKKDSSNPLSPFLKGSTEFEWLANYKQDGYAKMNSQRRVTVHYYQAETQMFGDFLDSALNIPELENNFMKKSEYPEYFKQFLSDELEGYYHACKFLKAKQEFERPSAA